MPTLQEILNQEEQLQPDDPRVDFDLHLKVQAALKPIADETYGIDHWTYPSARLEIRQRMKQERLRVIQEHLADKEGK
jgi:hypothetical protein